MTLMPPVRWSRRILMYVIVGVQVVILGWIVGLHEINQALDSSVPIGLEIPKAYAQKDPFRGAYIWGQPALDLDGEKAATPVERLQPGEGVLVFFAVEAGKRPWITRVERRGWGSGPPFSPSSFNIPGKVLRPESRPSFSGGGLGLVARVGKPTIFVELGVPASIPIEEAVLGQVVWASMVRASLRQGYLGHRYLADVRLSGKGFTPDISFTYDETQDRLIVLSPQPGVLAGRRPLSVADRPTRSSIFLFDGEGKEMGSAEVAGRLIDGVSNPSGGTLWALLTTEPWGHSMVKLAQVRLDGQVVQQSPQMAGDRVVGFDSEAGAVWILSGPPAPRLQAPFFLDRMTFGGLRGPRLGPFQSKPIIVRSRDQQVWVVEPEQHRVTRLDQTGRIEREYRDVNQPTDIAVDARGFSLIEAGQTQLSRFSLDGQLLWRIPRFQGLAWILPEVGTGGGWVGARRFEGREGGVLRYHADGRISGVSGAVTPGVIGVWDRRHLAPHAIRDATHSRLYVRESQAILILRMDGTLLKRVEGFRFAQERPLRG